MTTKSKRAKVQDERQLDRALEETFPASDAVPSHRATGTEPLPPESQRKAPLITKEQVADAAVETTECPHCRGTGRLVKF